MIICCRFEFNGNLLLIYVVNCWWVDWIMKATAWESVGKSQSNDIGKTIGQRQRKASEAPKVVDEMSRGREQQPWVWVNGIKYVWRDVLCHFSVNDLNITLKAVLILFASPPSLYSTTHCVLSPHLPFDLVFRARCYFSMDTMAVTDWCHQPWMNAALHSQVVIVIVAFLLLLARHQRKERSLPTSFTKLFKVLKIRPVIVLSIAANQLSLTFLLPIFRIHSYFYS